MGAWTDKRVLVAGLGATGWSVVRHLAPLGAHLRVCDSREAPPYAEALAREFPAIEGCFGALDPAALADVELLVASPGLDLREPLFAAARERGIEVIGDIELFARTNRAPVVAVTGSNGKSTVATLLWRMAEAAGLRVAAGGNLGVPALDLLGQSLDLVVLELSSFQLDLVERLDCVAATVLNLSADHLDRHGDARAYAAAKGRIFHHAARRIVNRDDEAAAALAGERSAIGFSTAREAEFRLDDGQLCGPDGPWVEIGELRLVGRHNLGNVLAAFALGQAAGLPREAMIAAAREFPGLPHRCEWVAERAGVRWINDSKGTNVGATLAALDGLDGPVILLAGGQAKGGDFRPWRGPLSNKGRAAMLFGQDATKIAEDLQACVPIHLQERLEAAVSEADALAQPGDSILLSPGCASLDQFRNYEERGARFIECVRGLS